MREHDALIDSYVHLDKLPRAKDALHALQKIASLVKPIMRNRGWRIGSLAEFFPYEPNLLGVNVDRGRQICVRLRYAGDQTQFMPLENVVDTMLHELCHIEIGPHDAPFHALWNSLRDQYTDLKIRGYTGDGFLSEGKRLGGQRIPMLEARRQSRLAAEKRKTLQEGSGQKLGGRPVVRTTDIRNVIADAAQRRATITKGCGSGTKDSERIADEATRNGFRTQAEEDQANDRAIAEALWEMAQEDPQSDSGEGSNDFKGDSQGLTWTPEGGLDMHPAQRPSGGLSRPDQSWPQSRSMGLQPDQPAHLNHSFSFPSNSPQSDQGLPTYQAANQGRPAPSIADQKRHIRAPPRAMHPSQSSIIPPPDATSPPQPLSSPTFVKQKPWTCPVCTLSNPASYLCCGACDLQRPCLDNLVDFASFSSDMGPDGLAAAATQEISPSVAELGAGVRRRPWASEGDVGAAAADVREKRVEQRLGWNCRKCGTFMESKWWTCSACGVMKASS